MGQEKLHASVLLLLCLSLPVGASSPTIPAGGEPEPATPWVELSEIARQEISTMDHDHALAEDKLLLALSSARAANAGPAVIGALLDQLSGVYRVTDEDRVEETLQEALRIKRRGLGQEHPAVADTLDLLADWRESQGRWDEALTIRLEALGLRREQLGPRHPKVAESLLLLGARADSLGDDEEALHLYQQAIDVLEESGAVNESYHAALAGASGIERRRGNLDRSRYYSEKAATAYERLQGSAKP